ncbi:leukocyte receptor cluster member 8 homolog isoform X2 [Halyomorpha halys]|uniref:leukocyte receptor cluster member 8 homolog isoform X2 n=1 Tax=Halyomorpha halys TaxID=286706 RepID=UPI0006D4F565|nr:leukocyte receptor cluster member 8 homolog isoform X2 [Halyomorpha halys]
MDYRRNENYQIERQNELSRTQMSLMADKSPAAAPNPQQVPQAWHYNMNMYNMNMYQNPYMYNPAAYGAHNYYQYYGQRMPNWGNYQGYPPGTQLRPWGMPPQPQQQQQLTPGLEQQPQIPAEQQQQPAEEMMPLAANNTNNQDYQMHDFRNSSFCSSPWLMNEPSEQSTELPPLPPGPPPGTPAPPGTQAPTPRPPFHQFTHEKKESYSPSRFFDNRQHMADHCFNNSDYPPGNSNCIVLEPSQWKTDNISRIEDNSDEKKESYSPTRFFDNRQCMGDHSYNKSNYPPGNSNCIVLEPSQWKKNNVITRIEDNAAPPTNTSNTAPSGGTTGVGLGVAASGGVGPIRFNMNAQRPRPQLSQANPLGPRPGQQTASSKKRNKKKKKQQQQQLQQQQQQQQLQQQLQQQMAEDDDEPETPPLPASPPPPPPPPPPPVCPPPPPQQPVPTPLGVGLMTQHPPGIRYVDDWPPSLRDYVNRCYAKCVLQVDMDRVGVILKGKILRATSDGTLWTKNWAEEPLPLDSDSKPAGGLTLGMNLKDKLNKMSSRLGPPQKNQDQPQQMNNQEINRPHKRSSYRPSFKRSYSSDSSSSTSSDSDDNSSSNNKRSSRDKRSSQSWNNKRHSNKKSEKAHLYKEYGSIGGGVGGPIRKEVLDKRAARFSCDNANRNKNGLVTSGSSPPLYVIDSKPNSQYMIPNVASVVNSANGGTAGSNNGVHDWEEDLHIVGTSTDIEKQYLRLTSAPDASQVRPPQILAKALSLVKEKWAKESDYHYTCEQLKSIRQDLTVQGIRDEFTIEVYETHARIALEKGDHAEFNQCQSQLCQLHTASSKNRGEFVAYRILYYIFTNEFLDLSTLVNSLREEDKADDCISHGLKMAKAWTSGLHSRLFKLYLTAPRMSPYLIDWFLARERLKALKVIIKAYRPAVPVDLLTKELAFGSIGDTLEFVDKFGLIFTDSSRTMVDCKSSTPILAAV